MMKALFATVAVLGLAAAPAFADQPTATAKKPGKSMMAGAKAPDETFVVKAARGGMAEVELGKLAVEKAASDEVKKFGQRMVDDHSKASDELKIARAEQAHHAAGRRSTRRIRRCTTGCRSCRARRSIGPTCRR